MFWILSNKLDLNQETRFTILVYSDGFRKSEETNHQSAYTLHTLQIFEDSNTFTTSTNRRNMDVQLLVVLVPVIMPVTMPSSRQFSRTSWSIPRPNRRPLNSLNKSWQIQTSHWSKRSWKFQNFLVKKVKTLWRHRNSSPGSMSVRSQTTGTTPRPSPTFAYAYEEKLMNGCLQQSDI